MTCPLKSTIYGTDECKCDCVFMTTDGCLLVQALIKYLHEDHNPIAKLLNEPIKFKPPREERYP